MKRYRLLFSVIVLFSILIVSFTIKGLYIPINFKKAYDNKTRSYTGEVGEQYWQNSADYKMNINYDPEKRQISGQEEIKYYNNSPDGLSQIVLQLFPNMYDKKNRRDFELEEGDDLEEVEILSLVINGQDYITQTLSDSLIYDHTILTINLDEKLLSDKEMDLNIKWQYTLNENSHNRMGVVDESTAFVAYFFPHIAVYDDIDGWNGFKYSGDSEFYNDFGDFDVSITVPKDYIIWATGELKNPEEVLTKKYLDRFNKALNSDDIIHIIDSTECSQKNITNQSPFNTWIFRAENVTDFAFASSDHYLWDATSIVVDKKTKRRVFVDAGYNKTSKDFYHVVDLSRKAISFSSFQVPAIAFPYPQMTVFNGLDAMEYPMMVNNMSEPDINETAKVTAHEIFHSYLPFYMGINETKYAWMDEGFTSFCDHLFLMDQNISETSDFYFLSGYKEEAGYALDAPLITITQYLKRPTYAYNSYPKPAGFFLTLRGLLGKEEFNTVMQEFMNRWNGKHPIPLDLFFTLNNVSGQNLDWFIKPWFYEFGYVDLALSKVLKRVGGFDVKINNIGGFPTAVHLKIDYDDGSTEIIKERATVWKKENRTFILKLETKKNIKSAILLDSSLLESDMTNNVFRVESN